MASRDGGLGAARAAVAAEEQFLVVWIARTVAALREVAGDYPCDTARPALIPAPIDDHWERIWLFAGLEPEEQQRIVDGGIGQVTEVGLAKIVGAASSQLEMSAHQIVAGQFAHRGPPFGGTARSDRGSAFYVLPPMPAHSRVQLKALLKRLEREAEIGFCDTAVAGANVVRLTYFRISEVAELFPGLLRRALEDALNGPNPHLFLSDPQAALKAIGITLEEGRLVFGPLPEPPDGEPIMSALLRWTARLAVVTSGLAWTTGLESLPLAIATGLAALLFAIEYKVANEARRRAQRDRRRQAREFEPLHQIAMGVIHGAAMLGLIVGVTLTTERIPGLTAAWYDRDRGPFEAVIAALDRTHQYPEIARLLEQRLSARTSPTWRLQLQEKLYRAYVESVWSSEGQEQRAWIAKAETLGRQLGHDPMVIEIVKDGLADRTAVTRLTAQHDRDAKQAGEERRRWEAKLQATAEQFTNQLLSWAEQPLWPLAQRQEVAQFAVELASQHTLDTSRAKAALATINKTIAAAQPRDLPRGASARLVSVNNQSSPPVVALDIEVLDGAGKPLHGLLRKDFRVRRGSALSEGLVSGEVKTDPADWNVVLLLDQSGSMRSAPLESAKFAAKNFLSSLPATCQKCSFAFASEVTPLGDWGSGVAAQVARISQLQAAGGTALYPAIDVGKDALRSTTGHRAIVLLTDGANNAGGISLDVLISQCQQLKISIFAVGLKTPEIQEEVLKRMAAATGGYYLTAENINFINARFDQIAQTFRRDVYRIVVPVESRNASFAIRIGGGNAVEVECRPTTDSLANATLK